ncbi:MAG: hypothetical protein JRH11_20520, partial [Deltaproteobacteria bacterium]|nr:hypothetical protein [Deltaproteobacteria bacterium]
PGAFGYDLAAASFCRARAAGVAPIDLLPAALPASWMVNNKTTSRVFRAWLTYPLLGHFETLLDQLPVGSDAFIEAGDEVRDALAASVAALAIDGHGVAAVSKVLALLVPETVPLLDDAAVHLLTGGVAKPETDASPTAGPEHFLPALDAFHAIVREYEAALIAIAKVHQAAPLDAAQVMDRVLWYDSYGYRHLDPKPSQG